MHTSDQKTILGCKNAVKNATVLFFDFLSGNSNFARFVFPKKNTKKHFKNEEKKMFDI